MKKKLTALVLSLLLTTALLPTTAHAATTFWLDMSWMYGTFDFAAQGVQNGDVIVISDAAQHVTLRGSTSVTYNDVMINIPSTGGTYFIIENLNITGPGGDNTTPLVVHGIGNTMEVRGTCNFLAPYDVGIQVETGDALTITGTGTLNVRGGYDISVAGAGIGGRYEKSCGVININGSVNVHAEGGSMASAIGGGGGRVEVIPPLTIVNHPGGSGGTVNISENAVVYASGSFSDIGAGYVNPSTGSLNISGNAAVFFQHNDTAITSYTNMSASHSYLAGAYKFGYTVTGTVGASITTKRLCTITYDPNGGTGARSNKYEQDTTVTLYDGAAFTRDGYTLTGWALSPDGIKDYNLSVSYTLGTSDVTLYAAWSPYDISYYLDGGTNNASNPATYETASTPIALLPPSKDGCSFIGWYDGADFSSANTVGEVPMSAAGNRSYYARWNNIPTLRAGVEESTSTSVTVGTQYSLNLGDIFADADGDALSYIVSLNGGAYTAAAASFTYTPNSAGTNNLYFKANDGYTDSAKTYHLELTAINPTPTQSSSKKTYSPNSTPTVAPTQSSISSLEPETTPAQPPAPTETFTDITTPLPNTAISAQVTSDKSGKQTATIDVSSLPEGTKAVKLPNGKTVSLENAVDGKLTFEVEESWVSGGVVEISAIGNEEIPLGYYSIDIPEEEALQKSFPVWLMIVGGIFLLFWIVFAFAHIFRVKTNPRYKRR